MKHLTILVLFSLSISGTLAGQEIGSRFILGGTISAAYESSNDVQEAITENIQIGGPFFPDIVNTTIREVDYSYLTLGFYPYLGLRTSSKVTVGVGLQVGLSRSRRQVEDQEATVTKRSTLGGYLWLRYTLNPESRFNLYLEPRVGYVSGRGNASGFVSFDAPNFVGTGFTRAYIGVPLGATYQISEAFLLNLRVGGLEIATGKNKRAGGLADSKYVDAGFSFRPQYVNFGVEYVF